MRGLIAILFILCLTVSALMADTWTQDYWHPDLEDTPAYTEGSYYAADGVATHRIWFDGTNNAILLDGPDWERSLYTVSPPSDARRIFCGTALPGNTPVTVLGGNNTNTVPRQTIFYSFDAGETWNTNTNTASGNSGRVIAVSPAFSNGELFALTTNSSGLDPKIWRIPSPVNPAWEPMEDLGVSVVDDADFFVVDGSNSLCSVANNGWGGEIYHIDSNYDVTEVYSGNSFYEFWDSNYSGGSVFVGADHQINADLCCYTSDSQGDAGWDDFATDYLPGANSFVRYADAMPDIYSWSDDWSWLAANQHTLLRVDKSNPASFDIFDSNDDTEFGNMDNITGLLVEDWGFPVLSYIESDGDVFIKAAESFDGSSWLNAFRVSDATALPALVQDAYGMTYIAGYDNIVNPVPRIYLAYPLEIGALISSVYDCGGPAEFQSLTLIYCTEEGSSGIKLRSSDNADMTGATAWSSCPLITNFGDLSGVSSLNEGDRYVQYQVIFHLPGSDSPWEQDILDTFTLTYQTTDGEPIVVDTIPRHGASDIPTNAKITIFFYKAMNVGTLSSGTILVREDGEELPWNGTWNPGDNSYRIDPQDDFATNAFIDVTLHGHIRDEGGVGMPDQNGAGPGLYYFSFNTGDSADWDPPVITKAAVSPNPTFGQAQLTLTGQVTDSDTGDSNIVYAEYFIDNIGNDWEGTAVSATDGYFDSPTEDLLALIDASDWSLGSTHQIYLHAADSSENFSQYKVINVETEGGFLDEQAVYAWPNPATTDTAYFKCTLGGDGKVELFVYDLAGRQVHHDSVTAVSGEAVEFEWNLSGVGSDVYLFRIYATETGGMNRTGVVVKKLAVVR